MAPFIRRNHDNSIGSRGIGRAMLHLHLSLFSRRAPIISAARRARASVCRVKEAEKLWWICVTRVPSFCALWPRSALWCSLCVCVSKDPRRRVSESSQQKSESFFLRLAPVFSQRGGLVINGERGASG
jgi:hypothetical protein